MKKTKTGLKRIVFVIGSLGRGGAETQLLMLMRGLISKDIKPQLFVLEANGSLREEIEKYGVEIIDGGYDSSSCTSIKILLLISAFWRLWLLLRTSRPEIVHGFLPLTNIFTAVAGKLAVIPFVITSRRALNKHQDRNPGWRYVDKLSTYLSDIVTANAIAVRDDTIYRENSNPDKFRVIYNGIEAKSIADALPHREKVRKALGLEANQMVIIIVANLIPYKGYTELLAAFSQLRTNNNEIRLLIVGQDRGIGDSLRNQASRLGIDGAVQWLGLRSDIPELLAASDIYVCASYEEGFSNSLLEAMAAGKPVVATRVGGNPEMLEEGKLGVLVEKNNASDLAKGIEKLLVDTDKRLHFGGLAAKVVAEKYSEERMIDSYLKLYQDRIRN
jgi:glycosyltransferase involved in cell wall biosynthesis